MTKQPKQDYEMLISRLDLVAFIEKFASFFAREKNKDSHSTSTFPIFALPGDRQFFSSLLQELDSVELKPLPKLAELDTPLIHLQKQGTLQLNEIFSFSQLVGYFLYLKKHITDSTPRTKAWCDKILIPEVIAKLPTFFTQKGEITKGIYPHIDELYSQIKQTKIRIDESLQKLLHTQALLPYLVDKSVHYINQNECLLLKAGYNHSIKGMVLERSQSGFFYLLPDSILTLKERQNTLKDSLEESLYLICKELSSTLAKHLPFLKFLNHCFDIFDSILARLSFAKALNLSFIYALDSKNHIILHEFSHPALHSPKPLSIDFSGDCLMITGVNAGGKTMLLKSILSACFLSKFLIPLKINPHHSKIPHFKHINAILSDPQNSKNDISTFAGRMLEFSQILNTPNLLLGIDEIELGTDADEAASLFKVFLEHLLENKAKILLTTHHKHLAALMANNPLIQLCAAMYDIHAQKPLFEFLNGSIGKSYAFETAQRYHIPSTLIAKAKSVYGADKQRLNELIERSSTLEITLEQKNKQLEQRIIEYDKKILSLKEQEEQQKKEFQALKHNLQNQYHKATQALKDALKAKESKEIHKAFNTAHAILKPTPTAKQPHSKAQNLQVNDYVKYQNTRGKILSIKGETCLVELESGMKLKEKIANLKKTQQSPKSLNLQKTTFKIAQNKSVGVSLDLHGMRGEEAIERLDEFLSNALMAGYDEVLVYHGIGTGILSRLVKEYLQQHPKIISFDDAPANMGGFGAKVIKL
ncbi:endonuclease MutS2 [Helicobacter magdeburgensis]|uniref:Endonuclease MutS2 n=1 Tax=Helicobacter magdeburgensis TaxID=471858 RepID=A0A4U8T0I0_9HELI|nr:endonuclease MutS2 [Helicobacter magdeburgensis]TLD92900.1 endonuclease MutS2 [Helicobacter magdeburgensis]